MIFISNCGNIEGPNPEKENTFDYIAEALAAGYDVKVDVWMKNNEIFLGSDEPKYVLKDLYRLENKQLWCHAKNIEAFTYMSSNKNIHCFWNENDIISLTTKGYQWISGKNINKNSIVYLPENFTDNLKFICKGICSNYIQKYKNIYT